MKRQILAILIIAGIVVSSGCNRENSAWENANKSETIEELQSFMEKYPDGEHTDEAATRIKLIEEERDWAEAKQDRSGSLIEKFINLYPSSNHLPEAQQLVVIFSLARDLDKILKRIPTGLTGAVGTPGSRYTLGVDLPFLPEESITLDTFGSSILEGLALEGGAIKILENRKAYLFGTLKVTVTSDEMNNLAVFLNLSDKQTEIDTSQPSSATVSGVEYELTQETGMWRLAKT